MPEKKLRNHRNKYVKPGPTVKGEETRPDGIRRMSTGPAVMETGPTVTERGKDQHK